MIPKNKRNLVTGSELNNTSLVFLEEKEQLKKWVRRVLVRCKCGNEFICNLSNIRPGHTTSCGCYNEEKRGLLNLKHGQSKNITYKSWAKMKERCNNPKSDKYKYYGGRGITICESWNKYENFLMDMGDRPSKNHSIERNEVDGNYTPDNCRWATKIEQANNKRNNFNIEHEGNVLSAGSWGRLLGIHQATINNRIRSGWSVSDTLTTSPGSKIKGDLLTIK